MSAEEEILDFDALRRERKPKMVRVNGKVYEGAAGLPLGTLRAVWHGAVVAEEALANLKADDADLADLDEVLAPMRRFLVDVFGEEAEAEIFDTLDAEDLLDFIGRLMEAYDAEGKVRGSNRESRRSGARSKPTSKGSIKSTSTKRASASNGSAALASRA